VRFFDEGCHDRRNLFLFLILEIGQETIKCSEEMSLFDICTFTDLFLAIN